MRTYYFLGRVVDSVVSVLGRNVQLFLHILVPVLGLQRSGKQMNGVVSRRTLMNCCSD